MKRNEMYTRNQLNLIEAEDLARQLWKSAIVHKKGDRIYLEVPDGEYLGLQYYGTREPWVCCEDDISDWASELYHDIVYNYYEMHKNKKRLYKWTKNILDGWKLSPVNEYYISKLNGEEFFRPATVMELLEHEKNNERK